MHTTQQWFLLIGLLGSCTPAPSGSVPKASIKSIAFQKIEKPIVDPSILVVTDVSFHKLEQESGPINLAEFRVSGGADYVELQPCPSKNKTGGTGTCENANKVLRLRQALRNFPEGEVVIKTRACVDSGRSSTGESCGAWSENSFTQGPVFNEELLELEFQIERLTKSKADLDERLKKTLETFAKDSAKCAARGEAKERLEGMRNLTSQFLQLGQSALSDMLSRWEPSGGGYAFALSKGSTKVGLDEDTSGPNPENQTATDPLITPLSPEEKQGVAESFENNGNTLQDTGLNPEEKKLGGVISDYGMKMGATQFTQNLPALGSAFFNFFTAKTQVQPDTCLAEATASNELTQLKNLLSTYHSRLLEVRNKIKALKGSQK